MISLCDVYYCMPKSLSEMTISVDFLLVGNEAIVCCWSSNIVRQCSLSMLQYGMRLVSSSSTYRAVVLLN
jgi:hypothetical protein